MMICFYRDKRFRVVKNNHIQCFCERNDKAGIWRKMCLRVQFAPFAMSKSTTAKLGVGKG